MKRGTLFLLISLFLFGCTGERALIPLSEGTPEQEQKLANVLTILKADFLREGYSLDLKIPIILIDPKKIGHDDASGFCHIVDGDPYYIGINPEVFDEKPHWRTVQPWAYTVLLHEIGHCVFMRDHDNESVTGPENLIVLKAEAIDGSHWGIQYRQVAKSVMNTFRENFMVSDLHHYYIREILGKERFQKVTDLGQYVEVQKVITKPDQRLLATIPACEYHRELF